MKNTFHNLNTTSYRSAFDDPWYKELALFLLNPSNLLISIAAVYIFLYGPILFTVALLHTPMGGMCEIVAGNWLRNNVEALNGLTNSEFNRVMGDMILDFTLLPITVPHSFLSGSMALDWLGNLAVFAIMVIAFLAPVIICAGIYKFIFK